MNRPVKSKIKKPKSTIKKPTRRAKPRANSAYSAETVLEALANTKARVRIFLGDSATGRDWMEEWHVTGRVSRSMGPQKVLIMVPTGSRHGAQIMTDNVVRIIADRPIYGKGEMYRHPLYHLPKMEADGLTVLVGGKPHARFKTALARDRWIDFMRGRRMTK